MLLDATGRCFERFIGILTEHFAGFFPTWLAPVQAVVLPITSAQLEYGRTVFEKLRNHDVRCELDERNEKIGYKIRDWETKKIPYMLVVGEKEKASGEVAVRVHKRGDIGARPLERFVEFLGDEINRKTLTIEEKTN